MKEYNVIFKCDIERATAILQIKRSLKRSTFMQKLRYINFVFTCNGY